VAGLVCAVLAGLGHGQDNAERAAGEGRLAMRLQVQVHQGRLSVDLWDAEVAKVLARIGRDAGILITGSPTSGVRLSAQFTDVELDAGLRRLLRLAALSYALRYAQGPTGMASVQEVRVFGAAADGASAPLNATRRADPDRTVQSRLGPPSPAD
jgi:hypothetical protein